jgi:hypothetical protein
LLQRGRCSGGFFWFFKKNFQENRIDANGINGYVISKLLLPPVVIALGVALTSSSFCSTGGLFLRGGTASGAVF